jgi:hypothetical protein
MDWIVTEPKRDILLRRHVFDNGSEYAEMMEVIREDFDRYDAIYDLYSEHKGVQTYKYAGPYTEIYSFYQTQYEVDTQSFACTCGYRGKNKDVLVHLAIHAKQKEPGETLCACRRRVNALDAYDHMATCLYLGPVECLTVHTFKNGKRLCQRIFDRYTDAIRHGWKDHQGVSQLIRAGLDMVVKRNFMIRCGTLRWFAQCGNTRFAQMQVEQLWERMRDNTQKRVILKELVKESNFASSKSKFTQLIEQLGKGKVVPLFKKTQGAMRDIRVKLADFDIRVRVNIKDKDFDAIWSRLRPLAIMDAQLFNFNLTHHAGPSVERMMEHLGSLLRGFQFAGEIVSKIIMYAARVLLLCYTGGKFGLLSAILIDIFLTSGTCFELATEAMAFMASSVRILFGVATGEFRAQSGGQDALMALVTIILTVIGVLILRRIPKESEFSEILNGVTRLGSVVRGASFAWDGIGKIVSFVMKKVYEWQTGLPAETKELELYMEGIAKWFEEIQELVKLTTPDEIARDSALCARLESLYRQGLIFSQKAVDAKAPREVMGPFNTHWAVLKNLYEKAIASGAFRSGPRVEPVVIYLYGTSGVGKSGMMWPLAADLLKVDGIPTDTDGKKDPTREIYMRNIEQEYWDGYKNQRVVIYDDFAQIVDSVGNPNMEFMELIRTGNLAPYPLHMASIEDKSKTYFNSRVIICTSNVSVNRIRPESISCREAVRRRFDLVGEVRVKAKYAKYGKDGLPYLDREKVEALTGSTRPSLDVYEITLHDPLTGDLTQPWPISYDEFSKRAVKIYQDRFHKSTEMHKFLQEYSDLPLKAQSLTASEEEQWLNDADMSVKLAAREVMEKWKAEQIQDFLMIYDSMKELLDPEARVVLGDLISHEMDDKELEYAWRNSFQEIVATNPIWTCDAPTKLKAMVKQDAMLLYSLGDVVDSLVEQKRTYCRKILDRLQTESKNWLTSTKSFCERVMEAVKAHPYISIALTAIPLVAGAISMFMGPTLAIAESGQNEPLDHHHHGMEEGKRILHSHECMWCDKIYQHTHKKRTMRDSVFYPQLCRSCMRQGVTVNFAQHEDGTLGFLVRRGRTDKFVEFDWDTGSEHHKCDCEAELDSSGDFRTRKKPSLKTELTGSGDFVTRRKPNMKTELTGSGDFTTRKKSSLRTELLDSGDLHTYRTKVFDAERYDYDEEEGDDYTPTASEEKIKAQLLSDPNALQVSKKILSNMYDMEVRINGIWQSQIKICFLLGRIALTVGHLEPYLNRADLVRISNSTVRGGHVIPREKLRTVRVRSKDGETKDQMLIVFPKSVHDHSDIMGSIASSSEMTKFRAVNGSLISPQGDTVLMRYGQIKSVDVTRGYTDEEDNHYTLRKSYQYNLETKNGDCGAVLMAIHSGVARKIIGIHVAGTIGIGMSSPLNIEDIQRAMDQVSMDAQISLNLDEVLREPTEHEEVELPEGDFVPIGKAIYRVATPTKTALRESLVHGLVTEPITAPSALGPKKVDGKWIDPMKQGLKKAGKIPPSLDTQILTVALNDVERIVNSSIDHQHQRILTDYEAVAGVEDDPFMAPINRKSSPGFPLSRDKGKLPGKMKWLGTDEYKLDPEIQRQMALVVARAKTNVRTPTVWVDTLKDERRPLEKVRIAKTRVFAAGPMVYTLVFRKYFLGFAAHCAKNRIDNEISVGTNVYSIDWTRTAMKLRSKGRKVIAGDFSNFDGTLVLELLAEIVEIVNKFYDDGEENARVRRVLWKEIVNSVHVCGDDVYLWTHSQPSGCPVTAILNSLYNSISVRYVWMLVAPADFRTMKAFNANVAMVSYGDDNCINISDEVSEFFNQLTIADGYEQIGMVYTDELKSGEMVPYRTLSEITYLKRAFKWDEEEHQYLAPLDLGVVLEMINWVRGDFDLEERTIENMETSAFELSLHGREVFEHWIGKYKQVTRTFEKRPLFLTYDEYRYVEAIKYGRLTSAIN